MTQTDRVQIKIELEDDLIREIKEVWHKNGKDWDEFMTEIMKLGLKHHKNGER